MIDVGIDAFSKTLTITFWMKLRRVHVFTNSEHLNGTNVATHQQNGTIGSGVAGFFVPQEHRDSIRKPGKQSVCFSGFR